jgi:hypothetical protein
MAQTTYSIDLTVGSGSVMGTITTNGDTGVLTTSDIVNWDLAVNDGSPLTSLLGPSSGNNSFVFVYGNAFTATATQLLFNFSSLTTTDFVFETNATNTYFCAQTRESCNTYLPNGEPPDFTMGDSITDTGISTPESGEEVIGTVSATPEPGTAILWLTGIVLMILTRKRSAQLLRLDTATHGSLSPH